MTDTEATATLDVDLSKLFTVSVDAGSLQAVLGIILKNISELKKTQADHGAAVNGLQETEKNRPPAPDHSSDLAELKAKVAGATEGLTDVQRAQEDLGRRLEAVKNASQPEAPVHETDLSGVNNRLAALEAKQNDLAAAATRAESLAKDAAAAAEMAQAAADRAAKDVADAKSSAASPAVDQTDKISKLNDTADRLGDDVAKLNRAVDNALTLAQKAVPVDDFTAAISELRKKVDDCALTEQLRGAEGKTAEVDARLTAAISDLANRLNGLGEGLVDAQGDLRALQDNVTGINNKMAAHETLAKFSAATDPNADASSGIANALHELIGRISAIEGATGDLGKRQVAADKRLGAAENAIDDLKALLKEETGKLIDALYRQQGVQEAADKDAKNRGDLLKERVDICVGDMDKLRRELSNVALAAEKAAIAAPPAASGVVAPSSAALDSLAAELRRGIKELRSDVDRHTREVSVIGQECSKNGGDIQSLNALASRLHDTKADRAELDGLRSTSRPAIAIGGTAVGGDTIKRIDDLNKALAALDSKLAALQSEKAAKDTVVNLSIELADLRRLLLQQKPSAAEDGNNKQGKGSNAVSPAELESRLADIITATRENKDWTKNQIIEIRATIEHIHHSKADASIVANKAERDYVENAMEKLMREVEQVLNSTNAGLIDTLDKSLNILRDMIDGKATKQDVLALKGALGDANSGNGNIPEGLAGFKGYRCLGCNRTMDGMRPRPMGVSVSAFVNRLPSSARGQQRQGIVSPVNSPAGYLTAPASH